MSWPHVNFHMRPACPHMTQLPEHALPSRDGSKTFHHAWWWAVHTLPVLQAFFWESSIHSSSLDRIRYGLCAAETPPAPFLKLAYSYMPLVWAISLAFWLDIFLSEGGTLLPVRLLPYSWQG